MKKLPGFISFVFCAVGLLGGWMFYVSLFLPKPVDSIAEACGKVGGMIVVSDHFDDGRSYMEDGSVLPSSSVVCAKLPETTPHTEEKE